MKNRQKVLTNLLLLAVAGGLLIYIITLQKPRNEGVKEKPPEFRKVEVNFNDKEYRLDYKKFDPLLVQNISLFDRGEKWLGGGYYDPEVYFEYPVSLGISSIGNRVTTTRDLITNLSKIINFDLVVKSDSDSNNLEMAELIFLDSERNSARYVFPKLEKGWNFLSFSKDEISASENFNWVRVSQIEFVFTPRRYSQIRINLAGLRGEPGNILYLDWNIGGRKAILLDKRGEEINLLARNADSTVVTIRKITAAKNFSFQSSLVFLSKQPLGLFFRGDYTTGYGYYLTIGGIDQNQWQLYKINKAETKTLINGVINNFSVKEKEKYYIKVEANGNQLKGYFSTNGTDFTLLGTVSDDEFLSGGVGITFGMGLFNDFLFQQ